MPKFFVVFLLLHIGCKIGAQSFSADSALRLMGTAFSLRAVAASQDQANEALLAGIEEIQRIEWMISSHITGSFTSKINQNAGIQKVIVPHELYDLIYRSKKISALTKGAYDISFGPLLHVWKEREINQFPPTDSISTYQQLVNYKNIQLSITDTSVFLTQKGMYIGFGSIGKGFAANKAKAVMLKKGATGGFVDASGDILFWGQNISNEKWNVAITDPLDKSRIFGWLNVTNMAVVTSGDYEKYTTINGVHYSHILDPRTGYPVKDAHSVTVICPDAELADALATSFSVLGKYEGIELANKLKGVECLIIDSTGKAYESKNLQLHFEQ